MTGKFFLILLLWSQSIYAMDRCNTSTIEKYGFNYVIFKEKPLNITSRWVWAENNKLRVGPIAIQHHPLDLKSPIVNNSILVPLFQEQGLRVNSWYAVCGLREEGGELCEDCVILRFCKCDCAKDTRYEAQIFASWSLDNDHINVTLGQKMQIGFDCPLQRRSELSFMYRCSDPSCEKDELKLVFSGGFTTFPSSEGGYIASVTTTIPNLASNETFLIQELFLETDQEDSPVWSRQKVLVLKDFLNRPEIVGGDDAASVLAPFQNEAESERLCQQIEDAKPSSGMKMAFHCFWLTLLIWLCF